MSRYSVLRPNDLLYRTQVVGNTYNIEVLFQITPEDIKNLVDNLKENICEHKWKIVIGAFVFFGVCYVLGTLD